MSASDELLRAMASSLSALSLQVSALSQRVDALASQAMADGDDALLRAQGVAVDGLPRPMRTLEASLRREARVPRTDIIGLVVAAGYLDVGVRCAALCRETWRVVPRGLSAADAARVRRDHPIWSRIINLRHGEFKETRLMWAIARGNLPRVRELCEWRARTDVCCGTFSPLHVAARLGRADIVAELLARGASVAARTSGGATPLALAVEQGHAAIAEQLLAAGADANAEAGGWTCLAAAVSRQHAAVVRALLAARADANARAAAQDGATPLLIAAQHNDVDLMNCLIAAGALVNAASPSGDTPLIAASRIGSREGVTLLLAAGADAQLVRADGATAASLACSNFMAPGQSHFYIEQRRTEILSLLADERRRAHATH